MESAGRWRVLTRLAELLGDWQVPHPLRVAVDGPDAAGKTRLADDLAAVLRPGRDVIRLSVDDFHRPAAVRRRRGPLSAEGYYRDSFDSQVIVGEVLRPLGPGGDGHYRPAAYDHRADVPVPAVRRRATAGSVLLFDGVFLLRPELRSHWDLTVYLHVAPEVTLRRAVERDREVFGSVDEVRRRYRERYLPGQALYRTEARPVDRADIVLDMADPHDPQVLRWTGWPSGGRRLTGG